MTIKKLTFCILCSVNAANLATEEDFNDEISSNSKVEENILINKNNWNTRKWGSIYFLFPHLNCCNVIGKFGNIKNDEAGLSFLGPVKPMSLRFLNFILSGVVEYKWMFHKYCGINVRLNLNNIEAYEKNFLSCFFFEPSIEWIWKGKGNHFFSGSFSPLGVALIQKEDDGKIDQDLCKKMWTLNFILLKYEYGRRFYLNFGKLKTSWYNIFTKFSNDDSIECIVGNCVSIEFGLNIIGVNDWKKSKNNINNKL